MKYTEDILNVINHQLGKLDKQLYVHDQVESFTIEHIGGKQERLDYSLIISTIDNTFQYYLHRITSTFGKVDAVGAIKHFEHNVKIIVLTDLIFGKSTNFKSVNMYGKPILQFRDFIDNDIDDIKEYLKIQ